MLFSATMPAAIVKIAAKHMKSPVNIAVAPQGTAAEQVDQEIFMINNEDRFTQLQKILARYTGSVLIFVRTKHGVKSLALKLRETGAQATEIHSDLSFGARKNSLNSFKTKKTRILVATDVAARGLDIDGIELVVNYNLPDCPEDYVHRIGRTGRAGKAGKAISLATSNEISKIRTIERLISQNIKRTEMARTSKTAKPSQSKKPFKSAAPEARSPFKSHRPDKPYQADRPSQPKKSFRSDKPFSSKKPFKSAESEHYSPFKSEKPNKPTRFAKSAGARPHRSFAADTTEQPSSRKFVTHSHPQSSAHAKPYNHKPYSHKKSAPASGSIYHRSKTLATKFSRSKHRSDQ
jgi:ATP-dependent RNA helicase RhlE